MQRIHWLDGLRGIAAFIVAFNHFFCGELQTPFRSFWAEPPEQNRRVIQLPPFRLLWALDAMVPLFMVVSGYTISHALLKFRDSNAGLFPDRLRSSIFRRPIRLFLPALFLTSCTQLLLYFGVYEDWLEKRLATHIKPCQSPWTHVRYLFDYVMDMMNILQLQWNNDFNGHLWTMPLELRGSYIVYFTIFVQAAWRPHARLWCLGLMFTYLLWYGEWDSFSFIAGLGLAEIHISPRNTVVKAHWTAFYVLRSAIALYLICLSAEDGYPPDYSFLSKFETPHWQLYDTWINVRRVWHAIGAVLFFSVALESPRLQRLLTTRVPQELGRLSFPIYLLHLPMYHMWSWFLRSHIWLLLWRRDYPSPEEEGRNMGPLVTVYILAGSILGGVVIILAELYNRFLDPQFGRLTRSIEMWLLQKDHRE
ncbi:hypothetical protein BO78DRAFT_305169 [Aspergillus sclerotiicarbonarius CBS 121057]|uniref:Acyltransferase 3 domain-containing protein n=1 Tax=Aspergillus sclerotiicarbonarius (strain CBS 121057 / IBT 28362) TaxID=1448318 RepID=A0A319ELW4_ASPSB|nr:hypothetical protein BO78DRAFT_305169 [Aspergillus sclerotiicarbonarius CBS 121057]